MKSIYAAGITAMALGFTGVASADDNAARYYVHLEKAGLEIIEYSGGGSLPVRNVVDAEAWQANFGYVLNENFSIEAGYSQSQENVQNSEQSFGRVVVRAGSKGATTVPFTDIPINIYALIGKTFGDVNLSDGTERDLEAFLAGVGFGVQLTRTFEIAGDWLTYGEADNLDGATATIDGYRLAGFSLGLRMSFGGGGDDE